MPAVIDDKGNEHYVEPELYHDFLFDCIHSDDPDTIYLYLKNLADDPSEKLQNYILWRLAEVDPGYVERAAALASE